MSWTTVGVKIVNNEPANHEFHNWNEENLKVALKWLKEFALKGYIVTLYHKTDGGVK
jgi:hypothetical protein